MKLIEVANVIRTSYRRFLVISTEIDEVRSRLPILTALSMFGFLLSLFMVMYWGVWRSPSLLSRSDNPRVVEEELRIKRGRILDAHGEVLAESIDDDGRQIRRYDVEKGGPAVGYYSINHGTSGIEGGLNELLSGSSDDFWDLFLRRDLLHQPPVGQDVKLTIDGRWQQKANDLLDAQRGALVIMSIPDGQAKVMASEPGYDPNLLDEQFEELIADERAPLLNRVTQGQFQLGLSILPFLLAHAVDSELVELSDKITAVDSIIEVDGNRMNCSLQPGAEITWSNLLIYQCPAMGVELAELLGAQGIREMYRRVGFFTIPDLPIATEGVESVEIDDLALSGVGQDRLAVSPLQMAVALGALANGGILPRPSIVFSPGLENKLEEVQLAPSLEEVTGEDSIIDPSVADSILRLFPATNGHRSVGFQALSGPNNRQNSWNFAVYPAQNPEYIMVLVLEDSSDSEDASTIGSQMLDFLNSEFGQ